MPYRFRFRLIRFKIKIKKKLDEIKKHENEKKLLRKTAKGCFM